MSHIFISYSKKNKDYARKLADHLIASGFDVWIDDRIDYGSEWEEAIQKAIEDCAAFLIIMTPESRDSKWVKRECQYAESQAKPQFPVLLSGEVFFRYGTTQYADVANNSLPPNSFLDEVAEHAPRKAQAGEDVTPPEVSEDKPSEPSVGRSSEVEIPKRRRGLRVPRIVRIAAVLMIAVAFVGGVVLLWAYTSPVTAGFHYYYDDTDPLTVHFVNDSTGAAISGYQWHVPYNSIHREANAEGYFPSSGVYDVTLQVVRPGSDVYFDGKVHIGGSEQPPEGVSFTAQLPEFIGNDVQFTSYVIDPRVVTGYEWTFGNLGSSNEPHPEQRFGATIQYPISLTVTFADNEQVTVSRTLDVQSSGMTLVDEGTPIPEATLTCEYDWFFSDPLPSVCPISEPEEYDTLLQWFGDGAALWRKPLTLPGELVYLFGVDGTYRSSLTEWNELTENSTVPEQECSVSTHELFVRVREELRLVFEYLGCPTSSAVHENYLSQRDVNNNYNYMGTPQGFVIRYSIDFEELGATWERIR